MKFQTLIILVFSICSTPVWAASEDVINLMDDASWVSELAVDQTPDEIAFLSDGDLTTAAQLETDGERPVDLIFRLPGDVAAPKSIQLNLPADSEMTPPARIDVLVSSISNTVGFSSVRTETIDGLRSKVKINLQPNAARWVMIRLYPRPDSDHLALAEIELLGRLGPPESKYDFGQSPTQAIALIEKLRALDPSAFALDQSEKRLFHDLSTAQFDIAKFETMALHASGVTDAPERAQFQKRIDELESRLRSSMDLTAPKETIGQNLLSWLHAEVLTGGYQERQTNLDTLLDTGDYNCVSSAVIYVSLGQRLGLDVRAIEVPDHAFAIHYDGAVHQDVETTTPQGFNPRRDRVAAFEQLTGYSYIPQSNKSKRREIGMPGLAALIYYNHGVQALREERYDDALVANFRALSLDPEFSSAIKNALAALGRWSFEAAEAGEWEKAVQVAAVGTALAPKDRSLASRQEAVWQKWAESEADQGRLPDALAILQRAENEVPGGEFAAMQAYLFIKKAEEIAKTGAWKQALETSLPTGFELPQAAREELQKWQRNLYIRWSNNEIDAGRYAEARAVLHEGHLAFPDDRRLLRNIDYVAQEGARATVDFPSGIQFLSDTSALFPDQKRLQKVAEAYVFSTINQTSGSSGITADLARLAQAKTLFADPSTFAKLGARIYELHGHPLLDMGDWEAAAAIYSAGLLAFPDARILKTNARYLAQTWQREALKKGGTEKLAAVNEQLRSLFPAFATTSNFAEAEVKRQVAEFANSGEIEAANSALDQAQLLLSADTYQELAVYVIDRHARPLMDTGAWSEAAAIYATGLTQFPEDRHLRNNAIYVAQEWTRAVEAESGVDGVIEIMRALAELFPGNDKIAAMGVNTLRRTVHDQIQQGRLQEARDLVAAGLPKLSPQDAQELAVTLFSGIGQVKIEARDWPAAMAAYDQGHALFPNARELVRNRDYIIQEWIADSYGADGVTGIISAVKDIRKTSAEDRKINKIVSSVLGRAVKARLSDDPKGALALIDDAAEVLPENSQEELSVYVYDNWAKSIGKAGDWASAVSIYDAGLSEFASNRLLKNNREWAAAQ